MSLDTDAIVLQQMWHAQYEGMNLLRSKEPCPVGSRESVDSLVPKPYRLPYSYRTRSIPQQVEPLSLTVRYEVPLPRVLSDAETAVQRQRSARRLRGMNAEQTSTSQRKCPVVSTVGWLCGFFITALSDVL